MSLCPIHKVEYDVKKRGIAPRLSPTPTDTDGTNGEKKKIDPAK
jgi:hypothetical protein